MFWQSCSACAQETHFMLRQGKPDKMLIKTTSSPTLTDRPHGTRGNGSVVPYRRTQRYGSMLHTRLRDREQANKFISSHASRLVIQ